MFVPMLVSGTDNSDKSVSNSHSGLIVHKLIIVWHLPHPDNHECGNVLACAHGEYVVK